MLDLNLGNRWIWYKKVWAIVYLVPSNIEVPKIYLLKKYKFMMSSCMTKLEFLPEPYMMFRLGKPFTHICCLLCIGFSQVLLMPYERFVMLLKSRSRTHHPHMHYSYTGSRRNNMTFHLDSLKKIFYSYTGSEHQKNIPYNISTK
jgi:hypothetical protein